MNNNFNYPWKSGFESEFNIQPNTNNQLLIIEGQQPYKQTLNSNNSLCVTIPQPLNNSFYSGFDHIAFLVSDWIKIQDSLEMIFNLLTGDSERSLMVLSYLRKNRIPATEFAFYLEHIHKLVLINRKNIQGNLISPHTIKEIKNAKRTKPVHFLGVGDRGYKRIKSNSSAFGEAIHPSGVNLNNHPADYYDTWYKLDNSKIENKTNNFDIELFSVLK